MLGGEECSFPPAVAVDSRVKSKEVTLELPEGRHEQLG